MKKIMVSILENPSLISNFAAISDSKSARCQCKQNNLCNLHQITDDSTQPEREYYRAFVVHSFKSLFNMYSAQVTGNSGSMSESNLSEQPLIIAGGLQQYLIKNIKKMKEIVEQPHKGVNCEHATFHDLPDSIHIKIFSYLTISELCVSSCVCRQWYCVASDNILWRDRLDADMRTWDVLSHTTNPEMYMVSKTDWTNKEIYLRCSLHVNRVLKQKYLNFNSLTNFLRTFWPKKTPRIIMFGPGLESETSFIARKILEDNSGMFTTTGMFPGQFEGMGSGFTMKLTSGATFHLITLYTSTRQERESRSRNERLQHSRLLDQASSNRQEGLSGEQYEVRGPVKDLCRTVDGFVFVIDASQEAHIVSCARAELCAMMSPAFVSSSVPIAVVSCVPCATSSRVPCVDVTKYLGLDNSTSRPWQVRDCTVDTMSGVVEVLEWTIEHAHKANK